MRWLAVGMTMLMLAGCNAIATRGDLLGFTGLGDDIQWFYERNAWEQSGSCLLPRMQVILRADVVAETAETKTLRVRYVWGSSSGAVNGGNTCRGTAERDFVVRPLNGRATVLSMTGGQRVPPR